MKPLSSPIVALTRVVAATVATVAAMSVATTAEAVPVVVAVGANLATAPYSFTYLGNVFTFGATGDIFNPLSVQNQAPSATGAFGGFLGIPVAPTSSFANRGTVTFGPTTQFATFPTATVVPYSNGDNLIGLRATSGGASYYGFAYTTDAVLDSIGFETIAGQAITATTAIPAAAVPEAATWAMGIVGLGMIGTALRRRRARVTVRLAYA